MAYTHLLHAGGSESGPGPLTHGNQPRGGADYVINTLDPLN